MSQPSPRPILKRSSSPLNHPRPSVCHAVHFPPSPSLTTHTFTVYSAAAYDRSPIVVSPNSCALPERGCPGRTYTLEEDAPSISNPPKHTRERHPRAMAEAERFYRRACPPVPQLIPDLSSESDESDCFLHTPLESNLVHHVHGLAIPKRMLDEQDYVDYAYASSALAFLPHPPSSRSLCGYESSSYEDPPLVKPKRRRERKNDSSRLPDRIPNEIDSLLITPTKTRKSRAAALSAASSAFGVDEGGCLGGF